MFSMVVMAALTTGGDLPDFGQHGGRGGCCGGGCYGGCMGMGYGGCMGMGYGGCMGMGMGMGYGGCMGMGYGGCMGTGYGGMRMGWGGGGSSYGGYSGYVMNGISPVIGSYGYSPLISNWSTPVVAGNGAMVAPGTTQSFYYGGNAGNQANEATIIVNLPEGASLTVDGQATQSRSSRRVFQSPPLEPGKTYTYTLRAELNQDGHFVQEKKTVDVRAGQPAEVTFAFANPARGNERNNAAPPARGTLTPNEENGNAVPPARPQRTRPLDSTPAPRSFPTPPPRDE
jgi:uncharacterized protein (TIGR03000 family)